MIQIVAANNAAGQFIQVALPDLQCDDNDGQIRSNQDTSMLPGEKFLRVDSFTAPVYNPPPVRVQKRSEVCALGGNAG